MSYHHGITPQELTQGILPMRNARTSTIGLIAIADDADEERYPLNTPVLLAGITKADITKAGQNGTLAMCLQAIRDIHNPMMVVMRVAHLGDVAVLDELLACQSRLGITPKIIGAPLLDTPKVVRKLVSIAKRRRAFVYASPRDDEGRLLTDVEKIVAYRNSFGDRELMIIENAWGKDDIVITPPPATNTGTNGSNSGASGLTGTNPTNPNDSNGSNGSNSGTSGSTAQTGNTAPSPTTTNQGSASQGASTPPSASGSSSSSSGATATATTTTTPTKPSYAVIGGNP